MAKKEKKNKNWFSIIGSFLIVIGLAVIGSKYIYILNTSNKESNAIDNFYKEEQPIIDISELEKEEIEEVKEETKENKINYIAVLRIPKINVTRGLVDPTSYLNNIKYNVQIIKGSEMPDVLYGNLTLAAHSGTAYISFFKDLDRLSIGDDAFIDYNNKTYQYKVVKKYDVEKTGNVNIQRDKSKNTLTLITCRYNTNKQIVVIAELV